MKKTQVENKAKIKSPSKKKRIVAISLLAIGLITLITGVVFLIINLLQASRAADSDYLVSVGEWVLEDSEGVVWDFTEVGKGTLTTNNHVNDYDFAWTIDDGKLIMKTDWLYELEDEYNYSLNQGAGELILTDDNNTYKFVSKQ